MKRKKISFIEAMECRHLRIPVYSGDNLNTLDGWSGNTLYGWSGNIESYGDGGSYHNNTFYIDQVDPIVDKLEKLKSYWEEMGKILTDIAKDSKNEKRSD